MDPRRPSLPQGPLRDTLIGHDVWIGQGARILPGARIGSGTIVGAGAVVGGEIPPYSVVTGNPGTVQRRRFDEATTDRLLGLAWWDWPIDTLFEACPDMAALPVEAFLDKWEAQDPFASTKTK